MTSRESRDLRAEAFFLLGNRNCLVACLGSCLVGRGLQKLFRTQNRTTRTKGRFSERNEGTKRFLPAVGLRVRQLTTNMARVLVWRVDLRLGKHPCSQGLAIGSYVLVVYLQEHRHSKVP